MLKPVTLRRPDAGHGEILIKVAAAGVNRPDIVQRQGLYPPPPGAPDTPGLEVAGHVVQCGRGVKRFKNGDPVMALVPGGGYAAYCVAAEGCTLAVPKTLSLIEAAGIPETFFTVWTNVFERAALKPDETLLVHGGASGIGTTAVMLAHAFQSRVFATAGTDQKCASIERLGAERAINYSTQDFVSEIAALTGGRGVDVILDMVGGDYVPRNLKCLAVNGRHVSIAFLKGHKAEISLQDIMVKRLTLTGSTLRPRSSAEKALIAREIDHHVMPLLADGRIRPVIDRTFPLAEAAEAHRHMERSAHTGKLILTLP